MKDQIGSSLNIGFQLALNQARVACLNVDLSLVDISKTMVDGQLVEIED